MEANISITLVGMCLNAVTTTSAAVIVYLTYLAKLKFDAEMITMRHRLDRLETEARGKEIPT